MYPIKSVSQHKNKYIKRTGLQGAPSIFWENLRTLSVPYSPKNTVLIAGDLLQLHVCESAFD